MKKKLEAELISIAHRILKIHNRQDVIQLQKEALNLYEKLSILRFYQDNFEPTKPTIGKAELEEALNEKQDFTLVLDQELQNQNTNDTVKTPVEPEVVLEQVEEFNAVDTTTQEHTEDIVETNTTALEVDKTEIPTIEVVEETQLNNEVIEEEIPVTYEELEANGILDNPSEPISVTILDEILEEESIETQEIPAPKKEKKTKKATVVEMDEVEKSNEIEVTTPDTTTEEIIPVEEDVTETPIETPIPVEVPVQEPDLFNFTNDLFSGLDDTYSSAAKNNNSIQSTFENLIGQTYQEPEFVKAEEVVTPDEDTTKDNVEVSEEKPKRLKKEKKAKDIVETSIIDDAFATIKPKKGAKSVSEMFNKSITLGLNDRIAFQMHLFNDSDQDLNRVVSQLNTMNNITEALDFINHMVKPDYNNWEGKEEFENRFMALVEKRFS